MNGKLALALILSLQVSLSLCEIPTPSQELVGKYEGLKATFYRRILTALNKAQEALGPIVEPQNQQAARDYAQGLQNNPKFQGVVKIATGLVTETEPLVEKARLAALGGYEAYLRPYIGTYLDDSIQNAQYFLNRFLPAQ
ncbi:hypothetical protein CRUP_001147 [Coryphaenoides rupestris]|nr:hypothetical protein CRUP_001147 [Coryphaenoides rupestris]